MQKMGYGVLVAAVLSLSACAYKVAPGADPVVVQAEAAAEKATRNVDAFLLWEYNNHDLLRSSYPDVCAAADLLRETAPLVITELRSATKAYKLSRGTENSSRLKEALSALDLLLATVEQYYKQKGQ